MSKGDWIHRRRKLSEVGNLPSEIGVLAHLDEEETTVKIGGRGRWLSLSIRDSALCYYFSWSCIASCPYNEKPSFHESVDVYIHDPNTIFLCSWMKDIGIRIKSVAVTEGAHGEALFEVWERCCHPNRRVAKSPIKSLLDTLPVRHVD